MKQEHNVREISPRVMSERPVSQVTYAIPNPRPTEQDFLDRIKNGVHTLQEVRENLDRYHGTGNTGLELVEEVRKHLISAEYILSAVADAGLDEIKLSRFHTRYVMDAESRYRGHIRTDVHHVLNELCDAIKKRMEAEQRGQWKPQKKHFLRMVRDTQERSAETARF